MPVDSNFGSFDRNQAAAQALEERAASHTVGLVVSDEKEVGSGILVRRAQSFYVLTAAHVIGGTPHEQIRFLLRQEGRLNRVPVEHLEFSEMSPTEALPIMRLHIYEERDLAAIELDIRATSPLLSYTLPFEDLELSSSPPVDQVVLFCGYPSEVARVVGPASMALALCIKWSTVQPSIEREEGAHSHFWMDFRGEAVNGLHPHSFSGAGVWYKTQATEIWQPNLRMAGIVQSFLPRRKLLECIRVEAVRDFVTRLPT